METFTKTQKGRISKLVYLVFFVVIPFLEGLIVVGSSKFSVLFENAPTLKGCGRGKKAPLCGRLFSTFYFYALQIKTLKGHAVVVVYSWNFGQVWSKSV